MFDCELSPGAFVKSDAQRIAAGLRQRDVAVLETLVEHYQYRLIRYLVSLLGTREGRRVKDDADLILFARPFISNPDLVEQFADGSPLSPSDAGTFYQGGSKGFTDYPRRTESRQS